MKEFHDVFISYSRRNREFAHKLYERLRELDQRPWLDQNEIPLATNFQEYIAGSIERAHNFILIISPDSLNSRFCRREYEWALENGKRILPLLLEKPAEAVLDEKLPSRIRDLNWIDFDPARGEGHFHSAMDALLRVLNNGREFVHRHTELLNRAVEWRVNHHRSEYLLRESEKREAESWLRAAAGDSLNPCEPAGLHCEFICESIKGDEKTADVFISFTRGDNSAHERVSRSLMRHCITTWRHRKDKAGGRIFEEVVREGIEKADNFLFFITRDSINEPFCIEELDYAASLNKRVITLLADDLNPAELPERIRAWQYLDFRASGGEKYEQAVNELLHELSKDRSYIREHKELLLDALRWARNERMPSLLTRGPALRQLETWLKLGRERAANGPLENQIEFITESRRREPEAHSNVFVNFTEADLDFAHALNRALRLQGKLTWKSDDFPHRETDRDIDGAVGSSDNFLFIVSRHSMNDPDCLARMKTARDAGKPIFAVARTDMGDAPLPDGLADHVTSIVMAGEGEEFETMLGRLIHLLDQDKQYNRFHTMLYRLAAEWKEREHDSDLLPRGGKLKEAGAWLEEALAAGKTPPPAGIVRDFILAGQEADEARREIESRRSRRVAELEAERTELRKSLEQMEARGLLPEIERAQTQLPEKLSIPRRIYGNHEQWRVMARAYRRVRRGGREVLLVSGEAGSGKSTFIDTFYTAVQRRGRAVAVRGAYEQGRRKTPYSALLQAFREWVDVMLTSNREDLDDLKAAVLAATGANARILVELLPALELILGDLPAVANLPPAENLRRFHDVLTKFVGAVTAGGKPLVLFLDDLQWADPASLSLLKVLSSTREPLRVLIICACEVDYGDMTPLLVSEDEDAPALFNTIVLENLNERHITAMLAESMGSADFTVRPLARLTLEKTGGNPFLTRRFLGMLHDRNVLVYDGEARAWSWDLKRASRVEIKDDLSELTVERIEALPADLREVLGIAACVGARFEITMLRRACYKVKSRADFDIWRLVREALILPSEGASLLLMEESASGDHAADAVKTAGAKAIFKFAHARIRGVAYTLLSEEFRAWVHLEIGRLLLRAYSPREKPLELINEEAERELFDILYQLNRGVHLIERSDEILRLAELNAQAGAATRRALAQDASLAYYAAGMTLLERLQNARRDHYELWYELNLAHAEMLALSGEMEKAAAFFDEIAEQAPEARDKARALAVRSAVSQSAGNSGEALAAVRAGLELYGVSFPVDQEDLEKQETELFELLTSPDVIERFRELPDASSDDLLMGRLYNSGIIAVYFAEPRHLTWMCARNLEHILSTGVTPEAGVAMAWFSMALFMRGHPRLSFSYAELSLELSDRFSGTGHFKGKTLMISCAMSLGWTYSFERIEKLLEPAFDLCHENGDMLFAGYILLCRYINSLVGCAEHHRILRDCTLWRDYCRRYVPQELGQAEIRLAATRRIMGLEADAVNAESIIAEYEAELNGTDACESLMELARLALLFGEFRDAYLYSERARAYVEAGSAGSLILNLLYWHVFAIACARMYLVEFQAETPGAGRYLTQMEECLEKVVVLGRSAPDNFDSYRLLMEAEKFRAKGDFEIAVSYYLKTIEHAGEHGRTLLQGLANEYLAELYGERGHRFARGHFEEAAYLYLKCGARGMSEYLRRRIRGKFGAGAQPLLFSSELNQVGARSLIHASQGIAAQTRLPALIRRTLLTALENTGAERGVVLLPHEGDWSIRAAVGLNDRDVELPAAGAMPLSENRHACGVFLADVLRTGESLLTADVSGHEVLGCDEYTMSRGIRSLLCVPVLRGESIVALLYLENTHAGMPFTEAERSVLELLAPQIGISLDIIETLEKAKAPARMS